jgi:hypothetical protein
MPTTQKKKPTTKGMIEEANARRSPATTKELVTTLTEISAFASIINNQFWSPLLAKCKTKGLRAIYAFFKEIKFGGSKDPSNLAEAVAAELAVRERKSARRRRLSRRGERERAEA